MSRKIWIILGVALFLAAAGATYFLLNRPEQAPAAPAVQPPAGNAAAAAKVSAHDMTIGDPKAPITMIEYAAPICPHCAHFNATVLPLLKKDYIDTGKVFYVFRVFPLQAADGVSEKLARCLPREKYFPFMDQLFANQKDWDPEYGVTDIRGGILKQAQMQGMSEDQFNACLADTKEDAIINQTAADAVAGFHLDHTPTIILNGKFSDTNEWDSLKAALDKILAAK
jgi:protein-disulfide isomerase